VSEPCRAHRETRCHSSPEVPAKDRKQWDTDRATGPRGVLEFESENLESGGQSGVHSNRSELDSLVSLPCHSVVFAASRNCSMRSLLLRPVDAREPACSQGGSADSERGDVRLKVMKSPVRVRVSASFVRPDERWISRLRRVGPDRRPEVLGRGLRAPDRWRPRAVSRRGPHSGRFRWRRPTAGRTPAKASRRWCCATAVSLPASRSCPRRWSRRRCGVQIAGMSSGSRRSGTEVQRIS
jgi:hypothetical protein